jgi:hypothetical protein
MNYSKSQKLSHTLKAKILSKYENLNIINNIIIFNIKSIYNICEYNVQGIIFLIIFYLYQSIIF